MNLSDIIEILHPGALIKKEIMVVDRGNGPFIDFWDTTIYGEQPTEQALLDQAPSLQLAHFRNKIEVSIRELVEAKPLERGYDSLMTLTSYTTSSNAQWKAEADAFIAWRDSVFAYAHQTLSDAQAELISLPSLEDFMAEMPTLTWP